MNLHILGIVLLAWISWSHGKEMCNKPADIVFVIDSSSSIYYKDFDEAKNFVTKLAMGFNIAPDKTQVAAIQFAEDVGLEFNFNDFDNSEAVLTKIGGIKQSNGKTTRTDKALKYIRTETFNPKNGARLGVPKICILLSDGASTIGELTLEQAKLAKDAGITLLAIGVGNVTIDELNRVVTPPPEKNFFYAKNFDDLKNSHLQQLVGQKACEVEVSTTTTTTVPTTTTTEAQKEEPGKSCQGKQADVVFVLDMSTSIWEVNFKEQLQFVADVVDMLDINSGKTRVAAMTFSDNAEVIFYLDTFNKKQDVIDAVLGIKTLGGVTNTHLALQKVMNELFTKEHGSRPSVAHICIVITDGISREQDLTIEAAKNIHASGVYTFAIGVGNETDRNELADIASPPAKDHMFEVNGYKALPTIKNHLAYKTCEVPQGDQPRCANDIQADVVFGMHGIGGNDRGYVETFIRSVGGGFDLASGNVRLGLAESCGNANFEISEFSSSEDFQAAVTYGMRTNLAELLLRMRTSLIKVVPKKSTADRILVLLVSGEVQNMDAAYMEAMRTKYKARIIVIGVGKGVDTDQLMKLASSKNRNEPDISHVLPVDNISQLPHVVKKVLVLMCQEQ